jgi:hypothetical protein
VFSPILSHSMPLNEGFLKWWYPQIIHFRMIFHYKPSILGYPHLWKPPNLIKSHEKSIDLCRSQAQPSLVRTGPWCRRVSTCHSSGLYLGRVGNLNGVSINGGTPIAGWFIIENPTGYPHFRKPPKIAEIAVAAVIFIKNGFGCQGCQSCTG